MGPSDTQRGDAATPIRTKLIVNADDFGLTAGVNDGIIAAHAGGIVTSASLMVRQPVAREAIARAKDLPQLGLGLHVDLGEWTCRDGEWHELYRVVDPEDAAAVEAEFRRQVESFISLVGRKPTHLDSHQHIHRQEPARSIVLACGAELGVPVRHFAPRVRYCGEFYGQYGNGQPWPNAITIEGLLATISLLPPGVTELACHPGFDDDLSTMYAKERRIEVATLCDPRVRALIVEHGIELITFADIEL